MRKRVAGLVIALFALSTVMVGEAAAHDWSGEGNCDEWTLTLDGTHGATSILINGVPQDSVRLTYSVPDTSSTEERTFSVTWDKASGADTTVPHTLERSTDGCEPPPCTVDCEPPPPPPPGCEETPEAEECQPPPPPEVPECGDPGEAACPAPEDPSFTG